MLEELQRRNLSPITTRIYLRAVEEFAQYYNKPPDRLGPKHIRQMVIATGGSGGKHYTVLWKPPKQKPQPIKG